MQRDVGRELFPQDDGSGREAHPRTRAAAGSFGLDLRFVPFIN